MTIIGTAPYRYEVMENWARLPEGWSYGRVTGVAVDSQERLYVCQQLVDPPILVFDKDGNFLNSWGTGAIVEPHTIYVAPDDLMYLADRGAHVAAKLTLSGMSLLEVGTRGQPSDTGCDEDEGEVLRAGSPFNRPTRMFPAPSGDLYVSDGYRNSRVHRFSEDGNLISSWGTPGDAAPAEFRVPHSVWIDWEGVIYVCDRTNNRIQIFTGSGEFVSQWTDVSLPTDIYIDADETVYICERSEAPDNWISVRDKTGRFLARLDTPRTHQIRVDRHGDIYLAASTTVTKYVRQS